MTRKVIIGTLKLNIKLATIFLKGKAQTDEATYMTKGLINGYRFAIELLKSK